MLGLIWVDWRRVVLVVASLMKKHSCPLTPFRKRPSILPTSRHPASNFGRHLNFWVLHRCFAMNLSGPIGSRPERGIYEKGPILIPLHGEVPEGGYVRTGARRFLITPLMQNCHVFHEPYLLALRRS